MGSKGTVHFGVRIGNDCAAKICSQGRVWASRRPKPSIAHFIMLITDRNVKEVSIYDARRNPPNWTDLLAPSRYAVFQHESATGMHVSPSDTLAETCLIFDTLEEARSYCAGRVEQAPDITCEIFDQSGRAKDPVESYVHRSVAIKQRSTFRSRFFWAHIMTGLAIAGLLIDWRSDFVRMWPTILGLKFLTLAILFYAWGLAERLRGRRFFRRFN
jgi:hypothetical protein